MTKRLARKRLARRLARLMVALLLVLGAGDALARRPPSGVRVECSSLQGRYSSCPTFAIGDVELVQQLSKQRCREYETWGSSGDGSSIWVRNGCRAVFAVVRGGRPGPGPGRTITCTSNDFGYNHCDVSIWGRRVYVKRQISKSRCIQGNNWGTDWRGIWVDRGCNAEFAIQ